MDRLENDRRIDENLKKFINREHNILRGPLVLVRNIYNGRALTDVRYGEDLSTSERIGRCYPKRGKVESDITSDAIRMENREKAEKNAILKGTGGRDAYVMLMVKNKDMVKGLSAVASAILLQMCLDGIQWNTGKLIIERSKKPHTIYSISKTINKCERITKSALSELSNRGIINYDTAAKVYFLSADIARKGATKQ